MSKEIVLVDNIVIGSINSIVVCKKRGRKTKKELEESLKNKDNIIVKIEEKRELKDELNVTNDLSIDVTNELSIDVTNELSIDVTNDLSKDANLAIEFKPVGKKRGRKPKGGKIIQQIIPLNNLPEAKPNVILHLKCAIKDLNSPTNLFGSNLEGYSFAPTGNLCYETINKPSNEISNEPFNETFIESSNDISNKLEKQTNHNQTDDNINKDICNKLKILEHNLHINNIDNKKSACFWDTCEFDNSPISIPKHYINNTYHVYGCFCSPECAVAYLMEEKIDSSVKFERYQLMNHIYSKVYNFNKNIKPAPNPYYILDKYYGNLNIQEYRSLLRYERLFLVVDKPLTRIMPELHTDNDDFIISNKIIPTNNTNFNKNSQKKTTKTNILSEHFGLHTPF
jgi:hypothetical protein